MIYTLLSIYTLSLIAMGLLRRGVDDVTNDVISVGSTFTSYDRCKFPFHQTTGYM